MLAPAHAPDVMKPARSECPANNPGSYPAAADRTCTTRATARLLMGRSVAVLTLQPSEHESLADPSPWQPCVEQLPDGSVSTRSTRSAACRSCCRRAGRPSGGRAPRTPSCACPVWPLGVQQQPVHVENHRAQPVRQQRRGSGRNRRSHSSSGPGPRERIELNRFFIAARRCWWSLPRRIATPTARMSTSTSAASREMVGV